MDTHTKTMIDTTERGPWMQTFSGRKFFIGDPRSEEVFLTDIAHHLSNICRYNGAPDHFYSVGQHSLILSEYAEMKGKSRMTQILALMHDAAEAYFGDHIVSLKAVCPALREIEAPIWAAVEERFSLDVATEEEWSWVKSVDKRVCNNEKAFLMKDGQDWIIQKLNPLHIQGIIPYYPYTVEQEFLSRAEFLGLGDTGRTI